jgi:hypothetical protein
MARKMPTRRKINAASNGHKESAPTHRRGIGGEAQNPHFVGLQAEPAKENSNAGTSALICRRCWRARKETEQKTGLPADSKYRFRKTIIACSSSLSWR